MESEAAFTLPAEAQTIAFASKDGARTAYLVTSADAEWVEAVELGPGDAFAALDARTPAANESLAKHGPRVRLAMADLLPVVEGLHHVAAGANYPEHGAEVSVEAPFLFPKLAFPDGPVHRLAAQPGWLLDYEVEIALVFDRDLASAGDLAAARAGVFLANDFTERAELVHEADLSTPGVGGGFGNAKGKPGFFPTGPFLVVPRDWRAFVRRTGMRLRVNGDERQRAHGSEMIWDVDGIVARALPLRGKPHFVHEGRPVALLGDRLPRGTSVLTGTPGGVVFQSPSRGFLARSLAAWAWELAFLREGPVSFVKRRYVETLRAEGRFLQPGDEVVAEADGLGRVTSRIAVP